LVICRLLEPTLDSSPDDAAIFRFRWLDSDDDVDDVDACFGVGSSSPPSSKLLDAIDMGDASVKLDCPHASDDDVAGGASSTEFNS
jgi:hypothetical protein